MPAPKYTPARRRMMQLIVWLLFVCNMGVAAGVIQWKYTHNRVVLASPTRLAGMEVRLPAGWMTRTMAEGGAHAISSTEQAAKGAGRMLIVIRGLAVPDMPLQKVVKNEETSIAEELNLNDVEVTEEREIEFSIGRGVLKQIQGVRHRRGRSIATFTVVLAAAVSPGGQPVTIRLYGSDDASGEQLVEEVAKSIRLLDAHHGPSGDDAI